MNRGASRYTFRMSLRSGESRLPASVVSVSVSIKSVDFKKPSYHTELQSKTAMHNFILLSVF
jgi:hypothetical protein